MQFPFNDGFPLYSISVVDTRQSDERWELSPALSSVSYLVKPNWVINEGYSIERVFLKEKNMYRAKQKALDYIIKENA